MNCVADLVLNKSPTIKHELMVELLGIFSRIRMDAIKELEG